MKKSFIVFCLLFPLIMLSCGSDDAVETPQQPEEKAVKTRLHLSVVLQENTSNKIKSLSAVQTTYGFQNGEELLVVDLTSGYHGKLVYDSSTSCFEGEAMLSPDDEISVVYPYPGEELNNGKITLSALPQDGSAPNPYYWGFTTLDDNVDADTHMSLTMFNLCNTTTVTVLDENDQPVPVRSVSLSATKGMLYASRTLNMKTGSWENGVAAPSIAITNDAGLANGQLVFSLIPTSALLHATVIDTHGNVLEGETEQTVFDENANGQLTFQCTTPASAKDYVIVCGIKWAKGNLMYASDEEGEEGFYPHWRLGHTQYEYFNPIYGTQGTPLSVDLPYDPDHVDLFNWGTCGENALDITKYGTHACTDIAAKMYTDKFLSKTTTDFDEALFGDVAYWATKGKWRMPHLEELYTLYDEASYSYGYVTTPDGNLVFGYCFTTPNGDRVMDNVIHHYTQSDLDEGLFLPGAGFRQQQTEAIKRAGKCGFYWDSYQPETSNRMCLRFIETTLFWSGDGALYGRSIRPVLNE